MGERQKRYREDNGITKFQFDCKVKDLTEIEGIISSIGLSKKAATLRIFKWYKENVLDGKVSGE